MRETHDQQFAQGSFVVLAPVVGGQHGFAQGLAQRGAQPFATTGLIDLQLGFQFGERAALLAEAVQFGLTPGFGFALGGTGGFAGPGFGCLLFVFLAGLFALLLPVLQAGGALADFGGQFV